MRCYQSTFISRIHFISIHYLKAGLAVLLVFLGVKMLALHWLTEWGFTTVHSLFVILGILNVSVVASLVFPQKKVEH